MVTISTNQGDIVIELMPEVAPMACENFTKLAQQGYYDGVIFHRVIPNFMIQGGDPTGTGTGGKSIWGKAFKDEVDPEVTFDAPGILAMANAGHDTNGSQFFITTAATPWLDMNHTIFGKVVKGMDVVKKIEKAPRDGMDKPKEKQVMTKVTVS
jgi:peptidylprolyl isomerase